MDANFGYSRFRQKGHYNTDSKKGITNKLHTIDKNKSSRNIALTSSRTHQAGRTSVMDEYMKVAMTKKKKNKYVHKVWFTYRHCLKNKSNSSTRSHVNIGSTQKKSKKSLKLKSPSVSSTKYEFKLPFR